MTLTTHNPTCNSKKEISKLVIFTDLDGTLLDKKTYKWNKALPAIKLCKENNIPIVIVSSKTRAEIECIHKDIALSDPFVSENGGGIFFPLHTHTVPPPEADPDNGFKKLSFGLPYDILVKGLREIREESKINLIGFSDMDVETISRLTGLDTIKAKLAAKREYDEPFIIKESSFDINKLHKSAQKRGMTIIEGGRFFHLQGQNSKGKAVRRLIQWYRKLKKNIFSVGLGDSPNDFSMLSQVDCPVLIRSQRTFPALNKQLPNLKITDETGPSGWNSAIIDILDSLEKKGSL